MTYTYPIILSIYQEKIKKKFFFKEVSRKTYPEMFTVALFTRVKVSINKRMNKQIGYSSTMKYYLEIKRNQLLTCTT